MKIGITTYYYNTYNYGANLQAFALCKVLKDLGYDAEQIRFKPTDGFQKYKTSFLQGSIYSIKVIVSKALRFINHPIKILRYERRYKQRCFAVKKFCKNQTSHSKKIYTAKNIVKSCAIYDGFITGSDVVWSPITNSSILFLRFVTDDKFKIAYAPSLGTDTLTPDQEGQLIKDIQGYKAISIRERCGVDLISKLTTKSIIHCLDSTLLLAPDTWSQIASKRLISHSYIFCYFLGDNVKARALAIEVANNRNLKVVNIAYYWPSYRSIDDFGDYRLYDVSPADFLSLIKYADYIFTDSFHACIFSEMFEKNFFAFRRDPDSPLNIRISDFLVGVNSIEQYVDSADKESIQYINTHDSIDYNNAGIKNISELIRSSINFLKYSISGEI